MSRRKQFVEAMVLLFLWPIALLIRVARMLIGVRGFRRILINGWYGTETIGDVAILGQVIREWRKLRSDSKISVASFNLEVTTRSLRDLDVHDVRLIEIGPRSGWRLLFCDVLVFGGGPLMESRSMPFWLLRALVAGTAGAKIVIHGCGVGPVRRRSTKWIIHLLLRCCTAAVLRDRTSVDWAKRALPERRILCASDPAVAFVQSFFQSRQRQSLNRATPAPTTIGLFLRDIPTVYTAGLALRDDTPVSQIADAVAELSKRPGMRFVGFVMHEDFPESNDRAAYQRLNKLLGDRGEVAIERQYHSLPYILNGFADLDACITVRFHGAVFAIAAGIPLVAIDYSYPRGKVSGAAENSGQSDCVLPIEDLTGHKICERLMMALQAGASANDDKGESDRVCFLQNNLTCTESTGRRQPLRGAWRYVVSLVAIYMLVQYVGAEALVASIRHTDLGWLVLHCIASSTLPFLFALELCALVKAGGWTAATKPLCGAAIESWSIGTLTPARAGDLTLAHFLRDFVEPSATVAIIAINRLVTLANFCVVVLATCFLMPEPFVFPVRAATTTLLALVVIVLVVLRYSARLPRAMRWLRPLTGRFTAETVAESRRLLKNHRFMGLCIAFAFLRFALGIAVNLLLFMAVATAPPLLLMAATTAASRILSLIPLSFWGVGIKEPLQIIMYHPVGISGEAVMAVSALGLAWMCFLAAMFPVVLHSSRRRSIA